MCYINEYRTTTESSAKASQPPWLLLGIEPVYIYDVIMEENLVQRCACAYARILMYSYSLGEEQMMLSLPWLRIVQIQSSPKEKRKRRREEGSVIERKWRRSRERGESGDGWGGGAREGASVKEKKKLKRLNGRVRRHEETVTAQLMPGHEMAPLLIMTALEKETERGARQ